MPTSKVEKFLTAAGCPCFGPRLAFHERYAGYVGQFHQDWFVWGLAHRESYWWSPNQVNCERDGLGWSVWCADGHPTCTYELGHNGSFAAHGGNRSFNLYVERVPGSAYRSRSLGAVLRKLHWRVTNLNVTT